MIKLTFNEWLEMKDYVRKDKVKFWQIADYLETVGFYNHADSEKFKDKNDLMAF